MGETEQAALEALRRGEIAGLGTLVTLHQLRALRTAYAVTGDRASAEDAVADAFLLVHERIAQLDPNRPFAPWFFRIVANQALSAARNRRRVVTGETAEATLARQEDPAAGPEEEALRYDLRGLIVLAIQGLPPTQRATLVQRYYLDLDEATMARLANCPPGTVKSRLNTARRALREHLMALGSDVPARQRGDRVVLRRLLAEYLEEAVPADRLLASLAYGRVA